MLPDNKNLDVFAPAGKSRLKRGCKFRRPNADAFERARREEFHHRETENTELREVIKDE